MARGLSARIARKWGPLRSYMAARARYSRVMSSDVVSPCVIASCSCETVFSKTVNGGMAGCDGRCPVGNLCALARCETAKIGFAKKFFGDFGDARDLRSWGGDFWVLAGVDVVEVGGDQAIADGGRESAARVVDFAVSFDDERHQRSGLPGFEFEREDVADVGRVEAGPFVGERIAVHVADRGQHAGGLRAEHVRRWAVAGWAGHRVGHLVCVLHDGDEAIGQIDLAVAAGRGCDGQFAAVFVRAGGAAPGDFDDSFLIGNVGERIEVAKVGCVFGCKDFSRDDDAIDQQRRDGIEAFAAVERQAEAVQVLIAAEQRVVGPANLKFQIAEAVERIGAAAGGDAAAVLCPGGRVLDVPELSVGRRQVCDSVCGSTH